MNDATLDAMWGARKQKEIAAEHAEADARVGGACGCAACCIERYGLTRAEHLKYRTTGKWPARVRRPV